MSYQQQNVFNIPKLTACCSTVWMSGQMEIFLLTVRGEAPQIKTHDINLSKTEAKNNQAGLSPDQTCFLLDQCRWSVMFYLSHWHCRVHNPKQNIKFVFLAWSSSLKTVSNKLASPNPFHHTKEFRGAKLKDNVFLPTKEECHLKSRFNAGNAIYSYLSIPQDSPATLLIGLYFLAKDQKWECLISQSDPLFPYHFKNRLKLLRRVF